MHGENMYFTIDNCSNAFLRLAAEQKKPCNSKSALIDIMNEYNTFM